MKKITLLSYAILMSFSLLAQFERVIPTNGYVKFLRTLKGDYALVYNSGDAGVLDKNGHPIKYMDYTPPVGGYWSAFDLVDTSVVFTGGAFWLEPWGWSGTGFYEKYNAQWELTWFPGSFSTEVDRAEKMKDGGFVKFNQSDAFISRCGNSGDIIWDAYYPGNAITDAASLADLTTVVATNQGLITIDSTGLNDSIYADYNFTHLASIDFEHFAAGKSDTVYLFSPDVQVLQKAAIPGETIRDIQSMENKLAVLTETGHVYLYDQDLLPISDFQLNGPHLSFRNIVPDQDGIVLAGDNHYGVAPHGSPAVFVKKYSNDGADPFSKRDVGLAAVQASTEIKVWPTGDRYKVQFLDTKFQVFNFSDTVLNSFHINIRFPDLPMEFPLEPNPIPQHFSKQFNNLDLAPGESADLSWDEFTATFLSYPSGSTLELCFWSSLPDGWSDVDDSNDVSCGDFFVDTKMPIDGTSFNFDIAPNPSPGICFVDVAAPANQKVTIQVNNLLGQTLQRHQLQSGINRVEIEGLSAGIYLVSGIVDGAILATQKLVVR